MGFLSGPSIPSPPPAPKPPPPPPPPPVETKDETPKELEDAKEKERRKLRARSGVMESVKTSPLGLTGAPDLGKTLLTGTQLKKTLG